MARKTIWQGGTQLAPVPAVLVGCENGTDFKYNLITVAWAGIVCSNPPMVSVSIRPERYSRGLIESTGEFTVNIPYGDVDSRILSHCGTRSGRDTDKIQDLDLTLVDSDVVQVPGICQLPLTLECRVIYKQQQDLCCLPQSVLDRFYPAVNETGFRDYHIAYYGEIVNAYLIEP